MIVLQLFDIIDIPTNGPRSVHSSRSFLVITSVTVPLSLPWSPPYHPYCVGECVTVSPHWLTDSRRLLILIQKTSWYWSIVAFIWDAWFPRWQGFIVYDVIVISPPGVLHAIFHDEFWKSEHDFLIVIHCNFLSGMHGFRHNEVFLQAEYDVIVISPPGGASSDFLWRILKEWAWLPDSVP